METRWLYTISEDFPALVEASKKTCVIPMGCVEKHSRHLPLGTDMLHSSAIAYAASQLETFCVFPDFVFGDIGADAPGLAPGYVVLPMDMEMQLLSTLCDQIARNGFEKIIVFNGHGGNTRWLQAWLRRFENIKHDYVPMMVDIALPAPHTLAKMILEEGPESLPELTEEDRQLLIKYHEQGMRIGHACFGETAYILGCAPETVRMDRLGVENGISRGYTKKFSDAGVYIRDGGWDIDHPDMFSGDDPFGCNERIGRAAIRVEAERLAKAVKVVKEDENLMRWHRQLWRIEK